MDDVVEFSGVEDAFQAGKRLFAEGKLEKAHEKLVLACVRAPQIDLYRLHEHFVGSRLTGKFADAGETRALASKLTSVDHSAAFASYVLGWIALEEGKHDSATRHFENAFRLDRDLLDAGRMLRKLSLGKSTPPSWAPEKPAKTVTKKPTSLGRTWALLGVLVVVATGTIGYVVAARAGAFSDYVEVR